MVTKTPDHTVRGFQLSVAAFAGGAASADGFAQRYFGGIFSAATVGMAVIFCAGFCDPYHFGFIFGLFGGDARCGGAFFGGAFFGGDRGLFGSRSSCFLGCGCSCFFIPVLNGNRIITANTGIICVNCDICVGIEVIFPFKGNNC